MLDLKIKKIEAMEVFDSRGNPTVQVIVINEDNSEGIAVVPSGASTGYYEAIELRDLDRTRFKGQGVKKAVDNVNKIIAKHLIGQNVYNQEKIDNIMIKLDGTANKQKLGANAILGVSMAVLKAAAASLNMPLYQYIGGISGVLMPIPMMNIINGGKHADNNLNIQEFMIVPLRGTSFKEYMKIGTQIYHTLKKVLKEKCLYTGVGDEGGFAPNLSGDEEAFDIIIMAIENAGYKAGEDFMISIDAAATEMYEEAKKIKEDGKYYFWKTNELKSKSELIEYWENIANKYPIFSYEDIAAEEDWETWEKLTKKLGEKIILVGDDLFVTNAKRLENGIENQIANAILIKLNQIGKMIGIIAIIICLFVFLIEMALNIPTLEAFKSAISLAVAAIPEGLTTVVTVCLAIGVGKMANQNIIVKRLEAVETLGCSDVVCTDKTGTLTANKEEIVAVFDVPAS